MDPFPEKEHRQNSAKFHRVQQHQFKRPNLQGSVAPRGRLPASPAARCDHLTKFQPMGRELRCGAWQVQGQGLEWQGTE